MKLCLVILACLGASLAAPKAHPVKNVSINRVTSPHLVKGIGSRSLLIDLVEFIALLPLDDIADILEDHLDNDGALAAVIQYLQSDRFDELVDEVLADPTTQDFIQYLEDELIPVDLIIGTLGVIIDELQPGVDPDEDGSLRPLLDEIEAILPIDKLVDFVNDKLQNDPDFQDLYTTIASEDGKELVDKVLELPEAQYIQQRLTDFGVDVEGVLQAVYDFFGWGQPPVPTPSPSKSE